jgi:hypothetical protein
MPSLEREPTPNLPMVKAMAPNAPSGANFMMIPTTPNKYLGDMVDELMTSKRGGAAGKVGQ